MIDPGQLRGLIVRPTLKYLGLHSMSAENLLMGTAAVESGLRYVRQLGGGPARGLWQMEPATHNDIHGNYLRYKNTLHVKVNRLLGAVPLRVDQLESNLCYAAAMCRVHYLRVPSRLPDADDIEGLAHYWKDHYNTHLGAGTPEKFVRAYRKLIEGS